MSSDSELLQFYARERSEPEFAELVRTHIDLVYFLPNGFRVCSMTPSDWLKGKKQPGSVNAC